MARMCNVGVWRLRRARERLEQRAKTSVALALDHVDVAGVIPRAVKLRGRGRMRDRTTRDARLSTLPGKESPVSRSIGGHGLTLAVSPAGDDACHIGAPEDPGRTISLAGRFTPFLPARVVPPGGHWK